MATRVRHFHDQRKGKQIPLLPSSADGPVEGVVPDFDVSQSHGPFRIALLPAPEKYKNVFPGIAALLVLKPGEVKEILINSGVHIT